MRFSVSKKVIPVVALAFINFLNFSILIPVLPFIANEFKIGNITYGILIALYPVAQILCVQFFAQLSNKFGRKPIILLTQVGTVISWILFCLAYFLPNILVFSFLPLPIIFIAIARIADGITGANMLVANAYIADIATKENRVRIFGQMEAGVAVGSLVGPIAGSILVATPWSFLAPGIFAFLVSLAGLFLILNTLEESIPYKQPKLFINYFDSINILDKILAFKNNKMLMNIFSQRFIFQMLFNAFIAIIFPYLIFMFNINRGGYQMTAILLAFGFFLFVNQLFLVPWLVDTFGSTRTFFGGQILMLVGLILFGVVSFVPILWVAFWLIMLGTSTSITLFKPFITTNVPQQKQAEAMAVEEQIMTFTAAVAPIIATAAYTILLDRSFAIQHTFLLFVVFACLGIGAVLFFFKTMLLQEGNFEETV